MILMQIINRDLKVISLVDSPLNCTSIIGTKHINHEIMINQVEFIKNGLFSHLIVTMPLEVLLHCSVNMPKNQRLTLN